MSDGSHDRDASADGGQKMSEHTFDRAYWERHWSTVREPHAAAPAHPYLEEETRHLTPQAALDVGCGAGAEAVWLAGHGWQVTGADIAHAALATASARAERAQVSDRVTWVETDLTTWAPDRRWELVVTAYAHPSIPHVDLYRRVAGWVAPGGTLLIIGHLHAPDADDGHHHPPEATVTLAGILALLDAPTWTVETARENVRRATGRGGDSVALNDVIVRARHTN